MKLPILINSNWGSLMWFLFGGITTLVLYQFTNRIYLTTPNFLEMSPIDSSTPLIPWTIWVYFTEYIIFIVTWLWLGDHVERTKYWYAYMAILFFSIVVFIIYPTTFPRADFSLDGIEPSIHLDV